MLTISPFLFDNQNRNIDLANMETTIQVNTTNNKKRLTKKYLVKQGFSEVSNFAIGHYVMYKQTKKYSITITTLKALGVNKQGFHILAETEYPKQKWKNSEVNTIIETIEEFEMICNLLQINITLKNTFKL